MFIEKFKSTSMNKIVLHNRIGAVDNAIGSFSNKWLLEKTTVTN